MLKVLYQKLRLSSKGNLNHNNYSNLSELQLKETRKLDKVGRAIIQGIPVLSIFALVGIIASTILPTPPPASAKDEPGNTNSSGTISGISSSSASLTITDSTIRDTIIAGRGETVYASHTFNVNARFITDYQILISGPATITNSTGTTTINGAEGATGNNMPDNTYGWGVGATTVADADIKYNSFSPTGKNIKCGTVSSGSLNCSGKLAFAAKFNEDADDGIYHADITLSMVSTPIQVLQQQYLSPTPTTQLRDFTSSHCAQMPLGGMYRYTGSSTSPYSGVDIYRLDDGNCWTTTIALDPGDVLTSATSDVASSYTIPDINIAAFDTLGGQSTYQSTQAYNVVYYTWCTATAGSCEQVSTDGTNAPYSICPKGFKLPTKSGNGSFEHLIASIPTLAGQTYDSAGILTNQSGTGYYYTSLYNFDTSIGYIYSSLGALHANTNDAEYWTRTAYSTKYWGYRFRYLYPGGSWSTNANRGYYGMPVRCVMTM